MQMLFSGIGWAFALSSVAMVPLIAAWKFAQAKGSIKEVSVVLMQHLTQDS